MKVLIYLLCSFSTLIVCFGSDKIKLSEISSLTLYANQKTNGRRSQGVPQLECIGGSAKCDRKYIPNVVQCTNVGSDGYDVQWTCKAELSTNVKFGSIDVNCEGYDYPNDKYVLKGSCGLRYSLDQKDSHGSNTYNHNNNQQRTSTGENNSNLMILIFIVVVVIIIVCWYNTKQDTRRVDPTCPPPAGFRPEYADQQTYNAPPPYSSVFNDKYQGQGSTNSGPGFWTGLGAGGAMGYLFGSSNNSRQRGYAPANSYPYSEPGYSYDSQPTRSRSKSPAFSTSSGFGGTSRR